MLSSLVFSPLNRVKSVVYASTLVLGLCQSAIGGTLTYDVSGPNGENGRNGRNYSGSSAGHGRDGGNAGPASNGSDAGSVDLSMQDHFNEGQAGPASVVIRSRILPSNGVLQESSVTERLSPASPRIRIIARGGKGGDGGHGGNGEDGGRGRDGTDATRSSRGTDGGRGYDGGDGGNGTPGGDGGRGGRVVVRLAATDLHLGFLLETIDVNGGRGGAEGENGSAGSGGAGGSGGSSTSWQEKTGERSISVSNGDGSFSHRREDVFSTRSNPGGSSGASGSDGRSGRGETHAGMPGPDGSFEFLVTENNGRVSKYHSVSDLRLISYELIETDEVSRDGIIEPSENLTIRNIVIQNTGEMPSPAGKAAVLIGLPQADWLKLPARISIPSLKHNQTFTIVEDYKIQIAPLTAFQQNRRWARSERIDPQASVTRVYYDYKNFSRQQTITITLPIEISEIKVPETLAPGERSAISFRVKNISSKPLGSSTDGKRAVEVLLAQKSQTELPFQFEGLNGEVQLTNGFVEKILSLNPNDETVVEGYLRVPESIEPYSSVDFSASLKFPQLGSLDEARIVQENTTRLRIGQKYRYTPGADILMIVNHNTERNEILAWTNLFKKLGLKFDIWDTNYYGYLNLKRALDDDGSTLMKLYAHKTVILLNNKSDREKSKMGSDALDAEEFVEAASKRLMNFYVIGGQGGVDFLKWLMTTDPDSQGLIENPSDLGQLKSTPASFVRHIDVKKPNEKRWLKRSTTLSSSLYEAYPDQRFVFEGLTNRVNHAYDQVVIRTTIAPARGRASYLSQPDEEVHTEAFVNSEANIRALLLNLPMKKKLNLLGKLNAVHLESVPHVSEYLYQAVLHDIVEEIDLWRRAPKAFHKTNRVAMNMQYFLSYVDSRFRFAQNDVSDQMKLLIASLAAIDCYLDAIPDSVLEDYLRADFDLWMDTQWPKIFEGNHGTAKKLFDAKKMALRKSIKARGKVLVGLDDVEVLRHLLVFPAKRELKTTDEILKYGNLVDKP